MRSILKLLVLWLIKVLLKKSKEKKRKQYDFFKKINLIEQIESDIPSINDAFNKNIDKSFVSRWTQNKKEIIDGASNQYLKLFKKNRKSSKHETKVKKNYTKDSKKQGQED